MRQNTRRWFLKSLAAATATVGMSAIAGLEYAALVEPDWPALEYTDVPIANLVATLDGFTIAQLSDLHRGAEVGEQDILRAVRLVLEQEIDAVVLTGDYVSGSARYAASCAKSLSVLKSSGDVFACLGNHDHWTDADAVSGALADVGIAVLRNEAREVGNGLWIAAVDDVWERKADLEKALTEVPDDATVLLLCHEPDFADEVAATGRVALQLSGHSHGGQIRLPFIGPPLLPHLGRRYHSGSYQVRELRLYVNRGIGTISPAIRFNCRPEVTLVSLRAT